MSSKPALWIAGGIAVAGAMVIAGNTLRDSPPPKPVRTVVAAARRVEPEKSRALARVGTQEITAADFESYLAIRDLSGRMVGAAAGLEELCERTVWVMAARDANVAIARGALEAQAERRKLVIGSLAPAIRPDVGSTPAAGGLRSWNAGRPAGGIRGRSGAEGHAPLSSPSDRARRLLAEAGVSDADFLEDVEAELLASGLRRRLQRERGSEALTAALEQLKQRWPIRRLP